MDIGSRSFDWNRARAFLAVAEEGSLSAAARALGAAQPTIGRQIAALEAELGVALFERAGRGLTLTPTGADLLAHARAMGEAAGALSLAATGRSEALEGAVTITASEAWAVFVLPPLIAALRRAYPGLSVTLLARNEISDLRRREADIAIRNAAPEDPELIGRKLGESAATLYAAPEYLASIGPLRAAEDFKRCDLVGFGEDSSFVAGLAARGLPVTGRNVSVSSANHLAHWRLVIAGAGIGVMMTEVGDAEPDVVRAAPWFEPFRFPVWLVAHRELRLSRRVRVVFDHLADGITGPGGRLIKE
ncbi:MAG: LysR family transcriptional regulator [Pseudomonadota bacterium]